MRYHEICEAPLTDFGAYGDLSREGTLRSDDLKAVQSPKWQEKLSNFFSRTPYNFNIYVYNGGEDGRIHFPHPTPGRKGTDLKVTDLIYLENFSGVYYPDLFQRTFGFVPPDYQGAISVMLVENEGNDRLPLTPWMVAHRIAHALNMPSRDDFFDHLTDAEIKETWKNAFTGMVKFRDVMCEFLGGDYSDIAALIGKTRAMRSRKLSNPGEFFMEMITQYIVQGSLTFNRAPDLEAVGLTDQTLRDWEISLNSKLKRFFGSCVGKIFVL
jgi:hypothetical protein